MVALVPVALVKVKVVIVPLVDARSVAVAAVELSDWMVEEEREMSAVRLAKADEIWLLAFKLVVVALVANSEVAVRAVVEA